MELDRRRFLQFVGLGAIAGKLNFRTPVPEIPTEYVINDAGWPAARLFVTVSKPVRMGHVELFLDRGGGDVENMQMVGIVMCNPEMETMAAMFDTAELGFLGERFRIIAKSHAMENSSLPIGGELELHHQLYRTGVAGADGLNVLQMELDKARKHPVG